MMEFIERPCLAMSASCLLAVAVNWFKGNFIAAIVLIAGSGALVYYNTKQKVIQQPIAY
jgi:hypothetical protein